MMMIKVMKDQFNLEVEVEVEKEKDVVE